MHFTVAHEFDPADLSGDTLSEMREGEFFVREVIGMLASSADIAERRLIIGRKEIPANARSLAAFVFTGPAEPSESDTDDWILKRFRAHDRRAGYDPLESVCRTFLPGAAVELLSFAAGAGRYVVVGSFSKAPEKLSTLKFRNPAGTLGSGWAVEPRYAACSIEAVLAHLDAVAAGPGRSVQERLLEGLIGYRRAAA